LDYASTVLPDTLHEVWRWCAYFAIFNPLLNAAIVRKALYPVTDLTLRGGLRESEIDDWVELLTEFLDIQALRVQINLDLYVYGHAAVSVIAPFNKYFLCKKCGKPHLAKIAKFKVDPWDKSFRVRCVVCKSYQRAVVRDFYIKAGNRITLRRWDPFELSVRRVGFSLQPKYQVDFSKEFRNQVKLGKREAIADTPQEFVEAILRNKKMNLFNDQVFIFEETALTPSTYKKSVQTREGWPWPTLAGTLPDCFHMKIVLKAEEALVMTQLIPFRMITPAASGDAGHSVNLSGAAKMWMDKMRSQLETWEQDPASVAISPIPSQLLQFGDPNRLLMPDQQVRLLMERILIGARTPVEFVWGGKSWSGASHSLRALDTEFIALMHLHKRFIRFVMKKCASILGWGLPNEVFLQPIMSGDEVQKLSILSGMAAQGGLAYRVVHERMGLDSEAVWEAQLEEQKMRVRNQAAIQRLQEELGLGPPPGQPQPGQPQPGQEAPPGGAPGEGQPQPGQEAQPGESPLAPPPDQLSGTHGVMGTPEILAMVPPEGVDPGAVHKISMALKHQSPLQRAMVLQDIANKNIDMHRALMEQFNPMQPVIERPLPEQLPPRRAGYS